LPRKGGAFLNALKSKFTEVTYSVLPVTLIVIILNFTLVPLGTTIFIRFLIGAALIILGLGIFLLGVDIGVTPIGNLMGLAITKSGKLIVVVLSGLGLGFLISVAEPDLHILAAQVEMVTGDIVPKLMLVAVVSVGIAVMVAIGLVRITYNIPLYKILAATYGVILLMSFFIKPEFLAISFDASGATTGAMTVPFILALAIGVSKLKKDSKASEKDSFGLVAIASTGAIIAVMAMSIFSGAKELQGSLNVEVSESTSLIYPFLEAAPHILFEVFLALMPLGGMFIFAHLAHFKLENRAYRRIIAGLFYSYIGLVIFLIGVNSGFMDVGILIGYSLALRGNTTLLVAIGFLLGFTTILAEPAVHVLTRQIEDVTAGYVKSKLVFITLSIGVGLAVALSMARIVTIGLELWHFLLPGYLAAIAMMFFSPKLFVGIAFDSGGVASGPMTATFILAFAQGAAEATAHANVLTEGFGIIAMVAMTPLIALQILGLVFKRRSRKEGVKEDADKK
jgi:hypothetical protein